MHETIIIIMCIIYAYKKNMRDEFEYPSFIRLLKFLKKSIEKKIRLQSTNEEISHLRDMNSST